MGLKMKLLALHLGLCSLIVIVDSYGFRFRNYCYDPPRLSCAEKHILDCEEGEVITTDGFEYEVSFSKVKSCQTEIDECKNKTSCCRRHYNVSSTYGATVKKLNGKNRTAITNFIETECSSKSSCIINDYYNDFGSSDLYDEVVYVYFCIPAKKDKISVDFLVNGPTRFTGNRFPTVYNLNYTGNGTKEDNETILNRECIVTTTEKDITLKIKTLNLQADDCYRFHISGYIVPEYCSRRGSYIPPKRKNIGSNTVTIRLENVVNKNGDSFSILVTAAGNVTIDCRTIEHVIKQEPSTNQYSTLESTTIATRPSTYQNSTSESTTITTKSSKSPTIGKDKAKNVGMDKKETNYPESDLAAIIGGTVGGLVFLMVFLNIIFIIIVVLIVRQRQQKQQNTPDILATDSGNGEQSHYDYIDTDTIEFNTNSTESNVVQNDNQRISSDINHYIEVINGDENISCEGISSDVNSIENIPNINCSRDQTNIQCRVMEVDSGNENTYARIGENSESDEAQTRTSDTANIGDVDTCPTPSSVRTCDTDNIEDVDHYNRNLTNSP